MTIPQLLRQRNSKRPLSAKVQLASCMRDFQQRKEVKAMKYETPELTALTPAINAIQGSVNKAHQPITDSANESLAAYQDWED